MSTGKPNLQERVPSLFGGDRVMVRDVIDLAGPWYNAWDEWKKDHYMCLLPPEPKGEKTTDGGIIVPATHDPGTAAVVLTRLDDYDDIEYAPAIVSPGSVTDLGGRCGLVHGDSVLCRAAWKKCPIRVIYS